MIYPIRFSPIYFLKIWGKDSLKTIYNRDLPAENVGESWDITCRKNEMGIVSNGIYKGKTFEEIIALDKEAFLGTAMKDSENFPLLLKLIDAGDDLSIQVHPDDAYANKAENVPFGKNEAWYIIDAPKGAKLIAGLKDGITKEHLKKSAETGDLEACLNYLEVKKGDVINIPSGLVHALTKGITLLEIQQNSDITYRVYDYNRLENGKERELHLEKAIDVIDFNSTISKSTVKGINLSYGAYEKTFYISNDYFSLIEYQLNGKLSEESDKNRFYIFTVIEGSISLSYEKGVEILNPGDSVFIPAALGAYSLEGKGTLVKTMVSDKDKDLIAPVKNAGYSLSEIEKNTCI